MKRILIGAVRLYQRWMSPLLPPLCRFDLNCSRYAVQALEQHGAWRGSWLTLRRILRCHPFYKRGPVDPVPDRATFFGANADAPRK